LSLVFIPRRPIRVLWSRDRVRLQSYLRPRGGVLRAPGHDGIRARGANQSKRPLRVTVVVGFPSRRSEPMRHHVESLESVGGWAM